jgi:uncharacterized repeat protein (TIGR04076 family)
MSAIQFHTITITVDSVEGKCPLGNKPGKVFTVKELTPAGMCISAFGAVLPAIQVLKYGGSFPWEKNPDVAYIGFPDHHNRVVYRLERTGGSDNEDICP